MGVHVTVCMPYIEFVCILISQSVLRNAVNSFLLGEEQGGGVLYLPFFTLRVNFHAFDCLEFKPTRWSRNTNLFKAECSVNMFEQHADLYTAA